MIIPCVFWDSFGAFVVQDRREEDRAELLVEDFWGVEHLDGGYVICVSAISEAMFLEKFVRYDYPT